MHNLNLRTTQASGAVCLYVRNAVLSSLMNCEVTGNTGIELVNPFMCSLRSVMFNGHGLVEGSNIGLLIAGGTGCTVEQCNFVSWNEGLRASGSELAVFASRP